MLVRVEISSFAIEADSKIPVLILKEYNSKRILPIPIGPLEAGAIALESMKTIPEKPLTIDLVKIVLEQLDGKLEKVVISKKKEKSYDANLHIKRGTKLTIVSCRAVDAIALAMRTGVDILIDESLLINEEEKEMSVKEKIRKRLRSLDTLEFGTYFME